MKSAAIEVSNRPPDIGADHASAVLCGSFRRDPGGLRQVFDALRERYELLAPASIDFADLQAEFVRLPSELDEPVTAVESRHLAAMRNADFVWLFCPDGYVGTSAAIEVGYAHALGVPVLTDTQPRDEVIAGMITVIDSLAEADAHVTPRPGQGLAALQDYYRRIAQRRGWGDESPRDTLLLLTEELGELARAVRKEAGIARSTAFGEDSVGEEIADVQLYLVHLATTLGIDLATAVTDKERINAARHLGRATDAA